MALVRSSSLFLLTGTVIAQSFSSPPGGAPGDSAAAREHPFFFPGRYQYVLGDVLGAPRLVTGLTLVADETLAPAPGQTVIATLRLGHARTVQFAELDTATPDNNLVGAATLLNGVTLNLPATMPGSRIPILAGSSFAYDGSRGLVVEFTTQRAPATDWYGLDAARGSATLEFGSNERLGLGCLVAPNVPRFQSHGAFAATTDGSVTRVPHAASFGPASQPGVLVLGLTDPNTTFGGQLCAALRASPDVLLPVLSSATGNLAALDAPLQVPIPNTALPLTLYSQFVVADPAGAPLGLALSNARVWNLPVAPALARRYAVAGTAGSFTKSVSNVPVMLFE